MHAKINIEIIKIFNLLILISRIRVEITNIINGTTKIKCLGKKISLNINL